MFIEVTSQAGQVQAIPLSRIVRVICTKEQLKTVLCLHSPEESIIMGESYARFSERLVLLSLAK